MKELDLWVFVAVFEEMLGPWLWVTVGAGALALVAFVYVLVRDRGIHPRRLVWSEGAAAFGGAIAVLVMQAVTHSGFADIGGPVDWVLGIAIFAGGAAATLIASYALLGLFGRRFAPSLVEPSRAPRRGWQTAAAILAAAGLSAAAPVARAEQPRQVLALVTSAEPQVQGMAFVLLNQMRQQGAQVEMMLCGSAADLARREPPGGSGTALRPASATPKQMFENLVRAGIRAEVCALYLPNAGIGPDALVEGVRPAQPADMARRLMRTETLVLPF